MNRRLLRQGKKQAPIYRIRQQEYLEIRSIHAKILNLGICYMGRHKMLIDHAVPNFADYTTPDEDPNDLAAIYEALLESLSPSSYLERRQVELIAHCDWEISRHRRQSAKLLSATVGDLINDDYQSRRLYDPSFYEEEVDYDDEAYDEDETETNGDDGDAIEEAPWEDPRPSAELVAKAYTHDIEIHAHHQTSADRLEARRRQLLRDLEDMKRIRSRAAIEDAEVSN